MPSFDSLAKASPFIVLSLLGGLSLASIILTFNSEDLPGVGPRERATPALDEVQQFQQDLRQAFAALPSLDGLCTDPELTLQKLDFGLNRQLILRDERWETDRGFFPQSERDAWVRCQNQDGDDHRRKLCFHFASQATKKRHVWDSPINIVELNLEWFGPNGKIPEKCEDLVQSASVKEVAVYYSLYWSEGKVNKGKEQWAFQRLTGGLRFMPRL